MGTRISEFSSAGTLTGAELVPVVQGGATLKATVNQISAAAPVQSVAGKTGAVTLVAADIADFVSTAAAVAPVQSVVGRTGAVTIGISDVTNLQTNLDGKVSTAGGSTITVATGTTVPLKITNLGTGNSFLVEDSTSPDASPFVITQSGNVGVGLTSPTYKLHVSGGMLATSIAASTGAEINGESTFISNTTYGFSLVVDRAGTSTNQLTIAPYIDDPANPGTKIIGPNALTIDADGKIHFASATEVVSGGLTVTAGGARITAGGLTVSAGGAAITGDSTVTGTFKASGNISGSGTPAANMTSGFVYIPKVAAAPTGTPTAITGYAPMYFDSTANRFYIHNGSAWRFVAM